MCNSLSYSKGIFSSAASPPSYKTGLRVLGFHAGAHTVLVLCRGLTRITMRLLTTRHYDYRDCYVDFWKREEVTAHKSRYHTTGFSATKKNPRGRNKRGAEFFICVDEIVLNSIFAYRKPDEHFLSLNTPPTNKFPSFCYCIVCATKRSCRSTFSVVRDTTPRKQCI